jgi:beta-lactamase regulating signal transducer with metallopeptidase domain
MNNLLLYVLKSTLCISLFYMVFRTLMRKEAFFSLNRIVLLIAVVSSTAIPLLYLPQALQPAFQVELMPKPVHNGVRVQQQLSAAKANVPDKVVPAPEKKAAFSAFATQHPFNLSALQLIYYLYLSGLFISILVLLNGFFSILLLLRKAEVRQMDGFKLLITDREVPSFAFGHLVMISQRDYDNHRTEILLHEQAHIRLNHFLDLLLLETVKIFHWFNPVIYWLIRDMKEIHEYQADDSTLNQGIDATQYQLLIIKKGVGSQWFALANSFNQCQIKKRIAMMNKQKTSKAWSWKVATFLPLLALLLMAFGRKGENVSPNQNLPPAEVLTTRPAPAKQQETSSTLNDANHKKDVKQLPQTSVESPSILGTWKLVSYNYSGGGVMHELSGDDQRIKLITKNNFGWVHYLGKDKVVTDSAGGTYTLVGDNYTEYIEYGGAGMTNYIGKQQLFKVLIEKETLYLSGTLSSGLEIIEVWKRIDPQ